MISPSNFDIRVNLKFDQERQSDTGMYVCRVRMRRFGRRRWMKYIMRSILDLWVNRYLNNTFINITNKQGFIRSKGRKVLRLASVVVWGYICWWDIETWAWKERNVKMSTLFSFGFKVWPIFQYYHNREGWLIVSYYSCQMNRLSAEDWQGNQFWNSLYGIKM